MRDGAWVFPLGMALVVAAFLASCFGPCSWFASVPLKDVPARCMGELFGGAR